jgi:hypothetical protein
MQPSTPPPTISLSVPAVASVNRTVSLSADVTAAAGVTRVEFLVDGAVAGTDTATPFAFDWDTSAVADGAHNLAARVTDAENRAVTTSAVAVTVRNQLRLNLTLTPFEIFPVPESQASGTAELNFNLISGAVTGAVVVTGMVNNGQPAVPTNAHIHSAYAGADGGVIVPFVPHGGNPLQWDAQAGSTLTAEQVTDLLAGRLYLNVHSDAYRTGEIRAQIKPENIRVVFTLLTGDAVRPELVTTTVRGLAVATVDSVATTAVVNASVVGADLAVEGPTAMHVHEGTAQDVSATVVMDLAQDAAAAGRWSSGIRPINAQDLTTFMANGWYVDLHSTAHPDGLVRGQIEATPPAPARLSELQTEIFTRFCAGCHSGQGDTLPGSMNLSSAANSFAALVNRPSVQQPTVLRVVPNQPDASYLVRKIEGADGITGEQMPRGGPFLTQEARDKVRSWIAAGALNN